MPSLPRRRLLLLVGLVAAGVATYYVVADRLDAARLAAIHDAVARRDFPAAREQLDRHLIRHPADADATLLAAQVARRADDFPAAERHLTDYLARGGEKENVVLEQALRRSQTGDLTGAANVYRFCVTSPDHPSVPFMIEALARGYLAAGQAKAAQDAADVWLRRDLSPADRGYARYLRALALERQARIPEALAAYRESMADDPRAAECRLAYARVLVREAPADARPLLEQLAAEGYRPAEVGVGLVQCYRQLGELGPAADLLRKLQAEQPDAVVVLLETGKLALDDRRPADAEAPLKRAVALAPQSRDARVQLARCLRELGREADAKEHADKVKEIDDKLFGPPAATEKKP